MRRHRFLRVTDPLAKHQRGNQRRHTRANMDHGAPGEVQRSHPSIDTHPTAFPPHPVS